MANTNDTLKKIEANTAIINDHLKDNKNEKHNDNHDHSSHKMVKTEQNLLNKDQGHNNEPVDNPLQNLINLLNKNKSEEKHEENK